MLGLDHNAGYLIWALGITVVVLAGYGLYLRSRLLGLRRRVLRQAHDERNGAASYSGRNVTTAAPMVSTAHAASSANGPRTP
jgi:hypothetical protein